MEIAAAIPPHAAEFASALMIILARIGPPGTDAAFAAPHLRDDAATKMVIGRMIGVDPVPGVGAHIHETAATLSIVVQGVELRAAIMLGMRARYDDIVLLQPRKPVIGDVFIGDA